jgi:hypothetical protein
LVANRRTYIAFTVKNTGRNYGTITAAALDHVDEQLPDKPTYDPAQIIGDRIVGADAKRIISDLSDKPLTFTQSEINGLANGHVKLKLIGYVSYDDEHWFLQSGIIGFCYVWNPTDTNTGNFNECSERNYTYYQTYWHSPSITVRDYPTLTVSTQTLTPTTPPMRIPDPKYHLNTLEIRRR